VKELNAAQQLWFALGLPYEMPKHKNGGPMNQGWGPSHRGWALHNLYKLQARRGYRRPLGIGARQRRADGSLA
jgi:hypothetical protein